MQGVSAAANSELDNADTYSSGQNFMQGFMNGINSKLEPAKQAVKNAVEGAIATMRKTQAEGSPSKITFRSGEFFGEGYINGIKATIRQAREAASDLVEGAIQPLNVTAPLPQIRGAVNSGMSGGLYGGGNTSTSSVTNNYNLVQNNTSPKPLSALDTYRARRQQISMIKAATQGGG